MVQKNKQAAEEQSKKKRVISLMLAALFCLFGIGMFLYARSNSVEAVEAKLKAIGENKDLSQEERREQQQELRRSLPQEMQRELWNKRGQARDQAEAARAAEYYKKTPQERQKSLRASVQREEQFRKEWEARRAAWANGAGSRNGAGGGTGNGQANGNAGGGPGGPGARGFGRGGNQEERQQARDARRDNITPEERAELHNYRYERNQARQAMGLPITGGGRGGWFGGRGR